MSDFPAYLCVACDGVVDMPICWIGAPIGDQLMRNHIQACPDARALADDLTIQCELYLKVMT